MRQHKPRPEKTARIKLPEGILPTDTESGWISGEERDYAFGNYGALTMHLTERFGWVIATLPISKGKRGAPDRTYAIPVKGDTRLVSVGNGPHVTKTITVRSSKSRSEALKPFHDLYVEGLERANAVRDRISSRRAQGQEMRDMGRTSWRWEV